MDFFKLNHEATSEDIKNYNYPNRKIGVIVHIKNDNGDILLQQRGSKSRDENGLFEDVGGKFDDTDTSYKSAVIRELQEEVGEEAVIDIGDSVGIYHCFKNDINWVFIVYLGRYLSGEIKVMEPEKCLGYEFFKYEDAIKSDIVTDGAKFLMKSIMEEL